MIGIIVALKSELDNFTNKVNDTKIYTVDGFKCCVFTLLEKPLILIYSGVGKANAAVATHILINHFKIDLIINVGFCGSFNKKITVGQFITPRFVSYFDVDTTVFDYKINQIPYEEVEFEVKNDLVNNLQKWLTSFGCNVSIGTLVSGDSFITQKNIDKFSIKKDATVVDMESGAIAQTCYKTNTPFCFIKLVSDYINSEKPSSTQWNEALKNLSSKLTEVLLNVCYQLIYSQS